MAGGIEKHGGTVGNDTNVVITRRDARGDAELDRMAPKQQPGDLSLAKAGLTDVRALGPLFLFRGDGGSFGFFGSEEGGDIGPEEPESPPTLEDAEEAMDAMSPRPGRMDMANVLVLLLISVIKTEQDKRLTLGEMRQIYMNASLKMADFEREMKMEAAQEKYDAAMAESSAKIIAGAVELGCNAAAIGASAKAESTQKELDAKKTELEDLKAGKSAETPGTIKIDVNKPQEGAKAIEMQEMEDIDAEVPVDQQQQIQQAAQEQAKADAEKSAEMDAAEHGTEIKETEKQDQKAPGGPEEKQVAAEGKDKDVEARKAKLEKEIKELEDKVKLHQSRAQLISGIGSSLGGIAQGSLGIVAAGHEQKSAILAAEEQRLEATREHTQRVGQGADESIGIAMQNINSTLSAAVNLIASYHGALQKTGGNI